MLRAVGVFVLVGFAAAAVAAAAAVISDLILVLWLWFPVLIHECLRIIKRFGSVKHDLGLKKEFGSLLESLTLLFDLP